MTLTGSTSNPYLNFHRSCFFPETRTDAKGKERKVYRYENLMTPYYRLKSLPGAKGCLKPGVTFAILDAVALQISDNQAAEQLQKARQKLFKIIHGLTLRTADSIQLLQTHLRIGKYFPPPIGVAQSKYFIDSSANDLKFHSPGRVAQNFTPISLEQTVRRNIQRKACDMTNAQGAIFRVVEIGFFRSRASGQTGRRETRALPALVGTQSR